MTDAHDQAITNRYESAPLPGIVCDLCQGEAAALEVDHCHASDRIRGHLCRRCNFLLGVAGDSLELLAQAAAYLQNPPRDGSYKEYRRKFHKAWRDANREKVREQGRERLRVWRENNREHRAAYRKARREAGKSA